MAVQREVSHRLGGTWAYSHFSKELQFSHKTAVARCVCVWNLHIPFPTSIGYDYGGAASKSPSLSPLFSFWVHILFTISVLRNNGSVATNLTISPHSHPSLFYLLDGNSSIIHVLRQKSMVFVLLELGPNTVSVKYHSHLRSVCAWTIRTFFSQHRWRHSIKFANSALTPFLLCSISYMENNHNP